MLHYRADGVCTDLSSGVGPFCIGQPPVGGGGAVQRVGLPSVGIPSEMVP